MELDEKHENSNQFQLNIYLGCERLPYNQNKIVTKSGSFDEISDLYAWIISGNISDVILAEIAANHIDMDPGWEHDDYIVEMTDPDGNEESSAKVRVG